MDYEKRFEQIKDFLKKHSYLFQVEMMQRYPHKLENPYHQWVKEIENFNYEQVLRLEKDLDESVIESPEFKQFIIDCRELSMIPFYPTCVYKIPQKLTRKLTPKKIHEIQKIKGLISDKKGITHFVDIGSGAGHLSCVLTYQNNTKSFCIDMNQEFQLAGEKKIKHWLPELKDKISFIHHQSQENNLHPLKRHSQQMFIGLHSCGALSTHIIKEKPDHLLNLGCCYHKLKDEYNISKIAQEDPLFFTNHALTMAAKCLGVKSRKDLENKEKVKRFRYPIHFHYVDHFGIEFQNLGNAKRSDYEGSFKDYIQKYCPELKDQNVDLKEIETNYYIKAGNIRALLGRLIELYIILDRVIYLKEHNKDAKLYQLFDPQISPRNLAIFI